MGLLRIILLFGSGAIALALIVAPIAERRTRHLTVDADLPQGLDMTSTGSIDRSTRYTLRRSVLQASPDAVCMVRDNGAQSGDC